MKPDINSSLNSWLEYLDLIHHKNIDLNLDRIKKVFNNMNLKLGSLVITIGGTNGKGSTCAFLESLLIGSGYSVGLYTSPHILSFTERIRLNGKCVEDKEIVRSFCSIDLIRKNISLTYFEYTTLSALDIFSRNKLDVVILEVGLGGRLDAVNIIDPDCSIVTNIGIDHTEWLGSTRESIAKEKSYIYRSNKPAICGDYNPPISLLEHSRKINSNLYLIGRDFSYFIDINNKDWSFYGMKYNFNNIALPKMFGNNQVLNASIALAALDSINSTLPINHSSISKSIENTFLPARFQIISNKPKIIIDVAHNPHAAKILSDNLMNHDSSCKRYAVIGMLKDKDIQEVVNILDSKIDFWYCASTHGERGLSSNELSNIIKSTLTAKDGIHSFNDPTAALSAALNDCSTLDTIVVFGSFVTVSDIFNNFDYKIL